MKNNGPSSISVMLASVLSILSFLCCTVRDDRDVCPARLELDCSGLGRGTGQDEILLVLRSGDILEYADTLSLSSGTEEGPVVRIDVPRSLCELSIFTPVDRVRDPLAGYRVEGNCAPLMAWSVTFVPERPVCSFRPQLRKEYCNITLHATETLPEDISCRLLSRVDGVLPGGNPSLEGCSVEAVPLSGGSLFARVLRQVDDSLVLELTDEGAGGETGGGTGRETVCRRFALGRSLAQAGYDWDAPELEDLELTLDFAKGLITLRTDKWSKTLVFAFVF